MRRSITCANFAAAVVAASQIDLPINALSYELVTDMGLENQGGFKWKIIFSSSIWMPSSKEAEIHEWFRDNHITEWFIADENIYVEDEQTAMMVFMRFS
jgi:hypothetical protein